MTDSGSDFHFKLFPIRPRVHIIYYLGNLSLLNKKIIGIVGPRMMSLYGKQVVETMFAAMHGYDVVTISGMADGVDQLCHTLSCQQNIPTIAVLG
jgi:DNA processing protein